MALLESVLPVLLYFLGSILIIVLIILVIKLIKTIDRANQLLDDVEAKVQSLNGLFHVIDGISSTMSTVGNRIVDGVTGIISSFVQKRKKKKENKEMDNYD